MMRYPVLSGIATALLLSSLQASAAEEASFLPAPELIQEALDRHPDVMRASAMVQSANAVAAARRAGPHEFTLTGEYVSRNTDLDGQFDEWTGGISRAIRLPGKANADRQIGGLGVEVADNAYEDARHQAALSLKELWLAWLAAEADYAITQGEVAAHEAQLTATERSAELGDAAELEVDQVRAALAQIRVQQAQADSARQEARISLQRHFPGLVLPAAAPALPEPVAPESAGDWEEWRMAVIGNSHEIKMAQSEAERRQWLARRARLDRFADPTLGLRAFRERNGQETGVGVYFSIPIGARLRNAESDALAAEAVAAEFEAHMATRDIEIVAEHDVLKVRMGLEAWRQSFAALEASTVAAQRMRRSYEVGESGLTEWLIAQRQDFEIRRAESEARVAAHDAVLTLHIDSHRIWGLGDE